MTIYIVSFALNMLFGLCLGLKSNGCYNYNELNRNAKKKKLYLSVTAVQLGLICGLRSTAMAYDTAAYKLIFDMCPDTWSHIFEKSSYVEPGFRILCSLIKIFGGGYQVMLILTSLFVTGSCCIFLYRHSKDVLLSVFIIISFPFFYSSFDIIRHFLATAFFLLGYKYIEKGKVVKYFIFIALGSLFHSIAWVFFLFYFVKKIKWNWDTTGIAFVGSILLCVYIEPIAILISSLLGKSSGIESGWIGSYGGGIRTALMYGIVLVIAIFAFYQLKDRNRTDMCAVNYVLLLFAFSIIFINARMMTRMIMTSVALLAIAMPQLLDRSRTKSLQNCFILRVSFVVIGLAYHAFMLYTNWQNVVPYIPYWS